MNEDLKIKIEMDSRTMLYFSKQFDIPVKEFEELDERWQLFRYIYLACKMEPALLDGVKKVIEEIENEQQ